ncbi:polysaccharide deacetylase family protein [Halomarina pelagica]|uniref:polysaccharide deacetylase family protein n=1 Tax=Halomarina pelagica TaxID=2961599 RepID=UPI0020C4117B|nr:polysaccharide deacetylase family protein [Halomarina sp. BND7]
MRRRNETATPRRRNGERDDAKPLPEPGPGPRGVSPEYLGRFVAGGRLVDDMRDLSRWSGEEVAADDRIYFDGPRSLRYEARGRVALTGDYSDDPIDLSDATLSFAAYFHEPDDVEPTLYVTALAPDRDNWIRFEHPYLGLKNAGWQRFDVAPTRTKGSPDLSDVRALVLSMNPGDRLVRFWLDDVRAHPRPDRGKLIFRFDDTHEHHYTEYFPVLREYGYPAIEAVVLNHVGRPSRLSGLQLRELSNAGWDLCYHTTAHQNVTELSADELAADVAEMDMFFRKIAGERADVMVYPYGAYDGRSMDALAEHFDLAFGGGAPTNYALTNPMCVGSKGVDGDLAGAKELVDLAAEYRSLSVPLFHHFDPAAFEELVEHVRRRERAGEIDVLTATDLREYLGSLDRWGRARDS